MQGKNTVTQKVVTWIASSVDWSGEQSPVPVSDVALYTRSTHAGAVIPINLEILEPTNLNTMVGTSVLITGSISRSGTVALSGLGSATVVSAPDGDGFLWSYLHTPVSAGSLSTTITATDAANGSTDSASLTLSVATAAVLPSGVTPMLRLAGPSASMFSDTAGATPAAIHGSVRRVNDAVTGNWQSPVTSPAVRDPSGVRIEPADINNATHPFPLKNAAAGMTSLNLDNCTLVVSWVQRWADWTLAFAGVPAWGASPNSFRANFNGTYSLPGFASTVGARHSMVIRWTPTAVKAKLMTNGVVTASGTVSMSIPSGNPNDPQAVMGQFQAFAYGTVVEMIVQNSAASDAKADELLDYVDSIPCRSAFPIDQGLLMATGDSNTVGVGTQQWSTPKFSTLRSLRATHNVEMICTAIVGASSAGHAALIAPYFDARRRHHVASCAAGTNDIATGSTGAASLAQYLNTLDEIRAIGGGGRVKVIAFTVQDRNGLFSDGTTHASYRTHLATLNAGIRAATSRYDALVDIAAIPQLGDDGASDNLTYFSADKVHFNDAGQQIIQAPYLAAVLAALAA